MEIDDKTNNETAGKVQQVLRLHDKLLSISINYT